MADVCFSNCNTNQTWNRLRAERKIAKFVWRQYDGHLEFLEIRVSGDYLRECNQFIIRLPSCPPSLSLSLFHSPLLGEPLLLVIRLMETFLRCTHYRYISVRLTIIISWYPIDNGPRRRAAVPPFFLLKKQQRYSRLLSEF